MFTVDATAFRSYFSLGLRVDLQISQTAQQTPNVTTHTYANVLTIHTHRSTFVY